MSVPYDKFAFVYDIMQYDVDYTAWADRLNDKIKALKPNSRKLLELATGTGNLAIELSKRSYILEGLDLSEEMLAVASQKTSEAGLRIRFYNQDMKTFNTKKNYDVIFSVCDGMNYLVETEDFRSMLDSAASHLNPEGLLIFDLSSEYKFKQVIGNSTFAETFENAAYIWENEYDANLKQLSFLLTLFVESSAGYSRYEEYHLQRAYGIDEIKDLLYNQFELLEILDGDSFKPVHPESHRICFIAKRKEQI
ncbi:class I SAM-dependent DNA methyltransferase [Fusibacter tunisiensis]|uniref:Ubiquinone/menaquinone biosynthesis C-methylase UbiE n=1 Tax=Fusibacter tunisiensis TaxID=1008308 RepID=A0ABS2MSC6_9FIRM|nr:class I SAM-dependent methyltransferase [Fusibacter tunisiensis]MBM7562297.1 ubiquinone/menaquinone biosynthesis C-methylase UbiE [Fusibacter tunisiensis]